MTRLVPVLLALVGVAGCGDGTGSAGDAGTTVSAVDLVRVSDVLNANDATDIEVSFGSAADETLVAEYRIVVVPQADAGGFSAGDAAALSADRYDTVAPSGVGQRLRLSAGLVDSTGAAITDGVAYQVVVVSVASTGAADAVSVPSRTLILDESSDILVSSNATHSVKRFDGQTGRFLGDFIASGDNGLGQTQEVVIGPDNQLYVTGLSNGVIKKYDIETGAFIENFSSGYVLQAPTKMTFGPDGNIYVSQWGSTKSSVAKFDGTTGAFIAEATPNLDRPMGHAWDSAGTLHVVNFGSLDVRRFDADGNEIDVLIAAELTGPVNLMFDGDDLLVVDWRSGSVQRYDGSTGAFKSTFITGMTRSEGIMVVPGGTIYVCDWELDRVNRYDPSGALVDRFITTGALQEPNSITYRAGL